MNTPDLAREIAVSKLISDSNKRWGPCSSSFQWWCVSFYVFFSSIYFRLSGILNVISMIPSMGSVQNWDPDTVQPSSGNQTSYDRSAFTLCFWESMDNERSCKVHPPPQYHKCLDLYLSLYVNSKDSRETGHLIYVTS